MQQILRENIKQSQLYVLAFILDRTMNNLNCILCSVFIVERKEENLSGIFLIFIVEKKEENLCSIFLIFIVEKKRKISAVFFLFLMSLRQVTILLGFLVFIAKRREETCIVLIVKRTEDCLCFISCCFYSREDRGKYQFYFLGLIIILIVVKRREGNLCFISLVRL